VNNPILNRNSEIMKTSNLSIDRSPLRSGLLFIALALGYFPLAPFPVAFGVVPPPDGGYPNFTTAEGTNALKNLTTGAANTAVGWHSLFTNTEGSFNTATGAGTLLFNTADENTAFGAAALLSDTAGEENTAVGAIALLNNTTGSFNTANGDRALRSNTTANGNTANGHSALASNVTGNFNTAIGSAAGFSITGSGNVCIGQGVAGADAVDDTTWIRNVFFSVASGRAVYVDSDNKIGTLSSSRRYKDEIRAMSTASEAVLSLRPVSFRYKKEVDPARSLSFGLIAEEVAKVDPDLVTPDRDGKPETVRYEAVNAMLLNEFLKEHSKVEEQGRKMQEQETTIANLKKGMDVLTAQLKEQASQIQKVSARVQARGPAPQVVKNP
jgi:hypothetical protein